MRDGLADERLGISHSRGILSREIQSSQRLGPPRQFTGEELQVKFLGDYGENSLSD